VTHGGMARRWWLGFALALVVATVSSGCSTRIVRRNAEKRLARRLEEFLGPAEKYRVRIYGTTDAQLVAGRVRRLVFEGYRILARGVLPVEYLWGELREIRYVGGEAELLEIRDSDLAVEFSEAGLNRYLREHHGRYQPELTVLDGTVRATILYRIAGTPAPIAAVGRLVVVDHQRLDFRAEQVETPLPIHPDSARSLLEEIVNPIVDLRRIDWPLRLDTVRVEQGRIMVHGSATVRQRLERE